MRKLLVAMIIAFMASTGAKAQFGYVKKEDIDKFKDSRLIVVLINDSTYNASIKLAVEKYWTFNAGFEFVYDSLMKKYNKPEFSFLSFSRGKKSIKIKIKGFASSEDDFNGLVITSKYRKRIKVEETIARGYASNVIDTTDWYPEMVRSVQILNNFFNYAVQAESDKAIAENTMMHNFPADMNTINGKKLVIELGMLQMKGKEDASVLYGDEVEEVERDEINKAILTQDPELVYMYHSLDEKYCSKIFVSAANSEVMYFESASPEQCKCVAKDLKAFKAKRDKGNKE